MTNWRTRSRPDLGRGSSRNLVWIWYQICGSCLYLRSSPRAMLVMNSSWVMATQRWRPRERGVGPEAILGAEGVVAQDIPAAGSLPDLGRIEPRQVHLRPADGVH